VLEVLLPEEEEWLVLLKGKKGREASEEFAATVLSCGTKTATLETLRELPRMKRDNKRREATTPKLNQRKSLLLCDKRGSEKASLFTGKRTCMLLL